MLWFVALVNMINFTDGMDGLAAGISGLGATTFAILAASLGRSRPRDHGRRPAGACIAFLVFNFHPARVFMGDSGSMLLGFVLAGVAISGVMKTTAAVAVVAPLVILAIPILDTSFVVLKRLKHGLPVYSADRSHFHHRFFNIGWGQRKTVLALYAWCALMGAVAVALRFVSYRDADGSIDPAGAIGLTVGGVVALAASVYLVYVLEILKWRSTPVVTLVRQSRVARAHPGGRRALSRAPRRRLSRRAGRSPGRGRRREPPGGHERDVERPAVRRRDDARQQRGRAAPSPPAARRGRPGRRGRVETPAPRTHERIVTGPGAVGVNSSARRPVAADRGVERDARPADLHDDVEGVPEGLGGDAQRPRRGRAGRRRAGA